MNIIKREKRKRRNETVSEEENEKKQDRERKEKLIKHSLGKYLFDVGGGQFASSGTGNDCNKFVVVNSGKRFCISFGRTMAR
jgi:hypothetical protein